MPTLLKRNTGHSLAVEVGWRAFIGQFTDAMQAAIMEALTNPTASGAVCFRNDNPLSNSFGECEPLVFGGAFPVKTLEEALALRLGNSPMTFKHPFNFYLPPVG